MKPETQALIDSLRDQYVGLRALPDGRVLGIEPMQFTWGLMVDLDDIGYRWRYCYEKGFDAAYALENWDGTGHPPGPWIVRKGHPEGELYGPGAKEQV
jgi:hypothetical protein